jgi:hypothetical protein
MPSPKGLIYQARFKLWVSRQIKDNPKEKLKKH